MGNIFYKSLNRVEDSGTKKLGRCALCETTNVPMEDHLFCKYCYEFYFDNM